MRASCTRQVLAGMAFVSVLSSLVLTTEAGAQESSPLIPPPSTPGQLPATQTTGTPAFLLNHAGRFGVGLNVGNVLTGVIVKLWAVFSVVF